jgi:DNA-binding NarL/FixJ family response regulator
MRGGAWLASIDRVAFRVLIVDDSPAFLEAARVLLEREGVSVVGVASTIAEALSREAELRPELVLVDITLGAESGFELARRLGENDRNGRLKMILVSTHAEADLADLIVESPANGFLPKSELSAQAICRLVGGDFDPAGPQGASASPER